MGYIPVLTLLVTILFTVFSLCLCMSLLDDFLPTNVPQFKIFAENKEPVCYPPLGCFPLNGNWFSLLKRPTPAPQKPEDIDSKIYYYNRKHINDGIPVYNNLDISTNKTDFEETHFTKRATFFIVHGYLASGNSTWLSQFKDAILDKMDANVFIVDWGKGASKINYFQVASNTRVVGAEIGRFIRYLQNTFKLKASYIHLIGHSLGAQASSYAAKIIKGIKRLTGLDAAQPGFEGMPAEVRIDKTDADFVDLIHTNIRPTVPTLGFGMISAVGHVDIYMNGGIDQPGCYIPEGSIQIGNLADLGKYPFEVLAQWISCSHSKAYEYFIATLTANCKFWARKTGKIRSIVNAVTFGKIEPITAAVSVCSSSICTAMGLNTPNYKARGTFASTTTSEFPYCDDSDPSYDEEVARQIAVNEGNENMGSKLLGIVDAV